MGGEEVVKPRHPEDLLFLVEYVLWYLIAFIGGTILIRFFADWVFS